MNQENSLIVVNKPKGYTSRDIVNVVCKVLKTKSVGHIGTLDPLAEGVLVLLTGKYTKLSNILVEHDKEYIASFKLGILTDTLDTEGNVLKEESVSIDKEKIVEALRYYTKTYSQEVPIYSAVKVNGRKLYDYARNNEKVDLPKKDVTVYDIKLLDINGDVVTIMCSVSRGTYIRSLIRDIGEYLGTYATMTSLVRTKLGQFELCDAASLEDVKKNNFKRLVLTDFMDIDIINIDNKDEYKKIKNGNKIDSMNDKYILYRYDNQDIALYGPKNNSLRPIIMF